MVNTAEHVWKLRDEQIKHDQTLLEVYLFAGKINPYYEWNLRQQIN